MSYKLFKFGLKLNFWNFILPFATNFRKSEEERQSSSIVLLILLLIVVDFYPYAAQRALSKVVVRISTHMSPWGLLYSFLFILSNLDYRVQKRCRRGLSHVDRTIETIVAPCPKSGFFANPWESVKSVSSVCGSYPKQKKSAHSSKIIVVMLKSNRSTQVFFIFCTNFVYIFALSS